MPLASVVLATIACGGALATSGAVRVGLIVVTVIATLPAACQGLVIAVVAWLPGKLHVGDRDEPPAMRAARRRIRRITIAALGILAILGVWLYAAHPGVASYQASSLLVFPLFIVALVWLHRRVPRMVEWLITAVLALIGTVGYLVVGGAQWWNWGQYAIYPLVLLIWWEGTKRTVDQPQFRGYGGPRDGPWGPP